MSDPVFALECDDDEVRQQAQYINSLFNADDQALFSNFCGDYAVHCFHSGVRWGLTGGVTICILVAVISHFV